MTACSREEAGKFTTKILVADEDVGGENGH